jgi:cyanophycinase
MPSLVPPGFTRGPILFLGPVSEDLGFAALLQRFWAEAGGYGARIHLIAAPGCDPQIGERCVARLSEWECDYVELLTIPDRSAALAPATAEPLERATGVLILPTDPVRFASTLGGTPLAQAIRRANARGKVVAALGASGPILCQHMIAFDNRETRPHPFLHRHLIQFAPGLGLVNRTIIDMGTESNEDAKTPGNSPAQERLGRLLTAVSYNPFLVGISLESDTGAALYADTSITVFGRHSMLVVDAAGVTHSTIHDAQSDQPLTLAGITLHVLGPDYTFHVDSRTVAAPESSDIPPASERVTSAY